MLRSNRLLFLLLTLWLLLINGSSAAGRSKLGASDPGSSDEPAASKSSTDTPHPSIVVTSGPDSKDDSLVVWSEPVLSNKPPGAAPAPNTSTAPSPGPEQESKTIAQVIDKALEKEFEKDTKAAEEDKGKTYNATVANEEGKVETVVRISGTSSGAAEPPAVISSPNSTNSSSVEGPQVATGTTGAMAEAVAAAAEKPQKIELGVDRIIDSKDNEFVLSAPKDNVATLTLDPQLIQDLTFLFASAALMGMVFESIKQPVINGYLVAGAIVGPGGLQLIKELVQVESLAQLGVQLLLFHLGRELSFKKLKSVWSVALLGGSLQIVALMVLGGIIAAAVKSNVPQGIFVGALLSMSSTSVVVKCLEAYRMTASAYGQITIGTLILQDCSVGLMFALMPAFGAAGVTGGSSPGADLAAARLVADGGSAVAFANSLRDAALLSAAALLVKVLAKLVLVLAAAMAAAKAVLPWLLRLLLKHASKELVQLSLVSLCLVSAWTCGQLGLSEELGAFIAGAMMSVAERKLVAAGLLLPGHNSSQATSPRQAHGHSSDNNSPASSPTSTPAAAAHHAAAAAYYAKVLGSGAGGLREGDPSLLKPPDSAFSDETLPLNALQPQPSGYFKNQSAGGEGEPGGDPAISMCTNIESIQNVLTALFIASMGLIMSPVFLMHHAAVLLLGTVVVTLVKAAVVTTVVRMFGVPLRLGLAVGLSMAHIGEFSLVLLSMANHLKLLSSQVYMLLLGVTAMSLLTTPFVILAAIHLLIKEGHHQLYISGPRLRLSSVAGDLRLPSGRQSSVDWAVVMLDGQQLHGTSHTAVTRGGKDSRQSTAAEAPVVAKRHGQPRPAGAQ